MLVTILAFVAAVLVGAMWGAREKYHADPDVFNVKPNSFFGSEDWRWRYVGGDPEKGLRHPIYKHIGVPDFWHVAGELHWVALVGLVLVLCKADSFQCALVGIACVLRVASARLSYEILEKQ